MSISIHRGTRPVFVLDGLLQRPFICLGDGMMGFRSSLTPEIDLDLRYHQQNSIVGVVTDDLAAIWQGINHFCCLINAVAEKRIKLGNQILLNAMISVIYPLLQMNFPADSVDEAFRLGLLAFSSHIFLDRKGVRLPHYFISRNYRACFDTLDKLEGDLSQVSLWFLMIGAISIFKQNTNKHTWLRYYLRKNASRSKITSWNQLREMLKAFPWIDVLHDGAGKEFFETISKEALDKLDSELPAPLPFD
jgi:hypothetical protein